jgi:hypothetical protein
MTNIHTIVDMLVCRLIYDKLSKKRLRTIIKDLSEADTLELVSRQGIYLQHVRKQTTEICMAAVKSYPGALEFVKVQTPEICLAAVENDVYRRSLPYAKYQTHGICLAAVKANAGALEYVKQQTPDICLTAVKKNGSTLRYVKEQTQEICLAAIENKPFALRYVNDELSSDIYMKAVKENGLNIMHIIDSEKCTPEIIMAAALQNLNALIWINSRQTTEELLHAVKKKYPNNHSDYFGREVCYMLGCYCF